MIFKMISVVLVASLLLSSMVAQDPAQSPLRTVIRMQQILRKAQEKNKAVKITLNKKIENQLNFSGKVGEISDSDFTLSDQKTGKTMQIAYADTKEIRQKGMSKTAKILIVSGIVVGTVIAVGFALACSAEGGPHC